MIADGTTTGTDADADGLRVTTRGTKIVVENGATIRGSGGLAIGVSVVMDDFGTGYLSLSTLRCFPFDKIKLDRSFMAELNGAPQSAAIIRAVLALGESLNIPVLAEGVETPEQLAFLRKQGCDEA